MELLLGNRNEYFSALLLRKADILFNILLRKIRSYFFGIPLWKSTIITISENACKFFLLQEVK